MTTTLLACVFLIYSGELSATPDGWEVGHTGTLSAVNPSAVKVFQVLDENSVLLDYYHHIIWLDGVDTSGLVDDLEYCPPNVFKVDERRSYGTAGGGSKKVWHVTATKPDELKKQPAESDYAADTERLMRDYDRDPTTWVNGIPQLRLSNYGVKKWRKGDIGALEIRSVKVVQVIDDKNALVCVVPDWLVWVQGIDTDDMADDRLTDGRDYRYPLDGVYKVGTHSYETSGGAKKTVWKLTPWHDEEAVARIEKHIAEAPNRHAAELAAEKWLPRDPDTWKVGDSGRLDVPRGSPPLKVFHRLGEGELILDYLGHLLWLEGVDTSQSVNGGPFPGIYVFRVDGRRDYRRADLSKQVWGLAVTRTYDVRQQPEEMANPEAERQNRVRTWKDTSGKFSVVAEFLGYRDGNVRIRREDDKREIALPLARLSEEDRRWVRQKILSEAKSSSRETQLAELRKKKSADEKTLKILDGRITQLSENDGDEKKLERSRQEREKIEQRIRDAERKIEQLESGRDSP